jgi:hypothetical protein
VEGDVEPELGAGEQQRIGGHRDTLAGYELETTLRCHTSR